MTNRCRQVVLQVSLDETCILVAVKNVSPIPSHILGKLELFSADSPKVKCRKLPDELSQVGSASCVIRSSSVTKTVAKARMSSSPPTKPKLLVIKPKVTVSPKEIVLPPKKPELEGVEIVPGTNDKPHEVVTSIQESVELPSAPLLHLTELEEVVKVVAKCAPMTSRGAAVERGSSLL